MVIPPSKPSSVDGTEYQDVRTSTCSKLRYFPIEAPPEMPAAARRMRAAALDALDWQQTHTRLQTIAGSDGYRGWTQDGIYYGSETL